MSATTNDFFNLARQAVMFSLPGEGKCNQLQTWRVGGSDAGVKMRDANFGANLCDKDKPFFWSRMWHLDNYPQKISWEYPALIISERDFSIQNGFDNKAEVHYNFQLAVLDVFTHDCEKGKCAGCSGRNQEEIYHDTEVLLFSALRFISKGIFATLAGGTEGLYNSEVLSSLYAGGKIQAYATGKDFGGSVANDNKNLTGYRTGVGADILGTAVNIRVGLRPCYDFEFDFCNLPCIDTLAVSQGCQTCG